MSEGVQPRFLSTVVYLPWVIKSSPGMNWCPIYTQYSPVIHYNSALVHSVCIVPKIRHCWLEEGIASGYTLSGEKRKHEYYLYKLK